MKILMLLVLLQYNPYAPQRFDPRAKPPAQQSVQGYPGQANPKQSDADMRSACLVLGAVGIGVAGVLWWKKRQQTTG